MITVNRPVEVLHNGSWHRGRVEAMYRDGDGRWHAFVRYSVAPGRQFLQWRDEDEVRKVEEHG